MLEKRIEAAMGRAVRSHGGLWYKFTSPGCKGVPDRLAVLPTGRVVFIEVKQETGELSPHQERQIKKLRDHGAEVHVVWSLEQAMDTVERMFAPAPTQEGEAADD